MAYLARLKKLQAQGSVPDPEKPQTSSSSSLSSSSSASANNSNNNSNNVMINYEYLKNCIYKYMITLELSEKQRLYRVIALLLNFTNQEIKLIEERLSQEAMFYGNASDQLSQVLTNSVGLSWDMFFGHTTSSSSSSGSHS